MAEFSLFKKTKSFQGIYLFFMINRLQMLYSILIMPSYLVVPSMIWVIIILGIFSHINLRILAKVLESPNYKKGYMGFIELFGRNFVRFSAFIGLFLILLKLIVFVLGYVDMIHQFIFPTMNSNWLILFLFLTSCYLASQGIENTIQFFSIVFLTTFFMVFIFFIFFFPPLATYHNLFPIIPLNWNNQSWKAVLFIWSALSGPEYLVFLSPWLSTDKNMPKYFTAANWVAIMEYLVLFIGSLLFFGSRYLENVKYPILNMIRYLQSPVFERIDIILISFHMIIFVGVLSLFILFFYGALKVIKGKSLSKTTPKGFIYSSLIILLCLISVNIWFWNSATSNIWLIVQFSVGSVTFFLFPFILRRVAKRKEGV